MKYLWYGFLGLFSLGFLGLMAGIVGVIGIVAYYSQDLPDYSQLKEYKPPIVTRLYAGDGRLMAEFAQEQRVFMPIETMPDLVKNAFIAAEDKNFYHHGGVDFIAIARAALGNLKDLGSGRRPKGASTITQQVAKNFLLTNEVSYERKIKEAILAHRMERAMSKERLLELYLNEIYMGARAYGVAAAALRYFNKALDELSIQEIAYLASLPKAPNNYHPVRHYDAAITRRNWVIGRMVEDGYITQAQADIAQMAPLVTVERSEDRMVRAPYFAEEVRRQLAGRFGENVLYGGGMAVRSTIDPRLQEIAADVLRKGLEDYDHRHGYRGPLEKFETSEDWLIKLRDVKSPPEMLPSWHKAFVLKVGQDQAEVGFLTGERGTIYRENMTWARPCLDALCRERGEPVTHLEQVVSVGDVIMLEPLAELDGEYALKQVPMIQGALVALDPHTGRILAMQGGWKYVPAYDEFNRATQARRQPGSAFKPFVYLAALDNGFTPATLVLDAPFAVEDRPGNVWSPSNYSNEYYGPTPIRVGIEKSRNLMTVRLADFLGMDLVAEYAQRFGITDHMRPLLANSLGAMETDLLALTSAYAVFVNGGKQIVPSMIDRIQDRRGDTIFRHDSRPCLDCGELVKWQQQPAPPVPDTRQQIADPRTSYQIVSMLEGVVKRGTGVRINQLGRPLAGKTGTTNDSKDAWFIGFSPDLVVGVFIGFDEPRSLGEKETGSSVAVPIFKDFMQEALKDEPFTPFRIPPGIRQVQINADTGVRAQPGDERVIWEAFVTGTEPTDNMFILDGTGITPMPSFSSEPGSEGQGSLPLSGTGGLY